jgi:hypothetical protein
VLLVSSRVYVATALVLVLAATGCAIQRHKAHVRDGLLIQGLHRDAFLEEWGLPTRTSTVTGDEAIRAGWVSGGGYFFKGKAVYDVWEYSGREVTLFFYRAKLVTWKTEKTVEQLRKK